METDKRHVDFRLRLRHDGLKQQEFFNAILAGYVERDSRILEFIEELKLQLSRYGKARLGRISADLSSGREVEKLYGLSDKEKDSIFDTIEQEFGE